MLTKATGQPLTVALLGVVITMVASRSVNEPDPRQQRITMALLPVPAALAITAAAVLAPHTVASDVVFVMVVFTAAYIRRFGARGRALGMVAFMAYFFTLYLRASISELPWMIGAVAVGTVCTFVMTTYVLPDRPERVLRATIRALRARMAIVVDTTAEAVRTGRFDERRRRRMRARTIRLNETALMVQSQIEDKADPAMLWPGVAAEQLAPCCWTPNWPSMGRHCRPTCRGPRFRDTQRHTSSTESDSSARSPSSPGRSAWGRLQRVEVAQCGLRRHLCLHGTGCQHRAGRETSHHYRGDSHEDFFSADRLCRGRSNARPFCYRSQNIRGYHSPNHCGSSQV